MRSTVAVIVLFCLAANLVFSASAPVIGVAVSQGRMEIEQAPVEGSGTLTEGVSLSSALSPARIRLKNGNAATLASNSRARVFQNRIVLEKGQVLSTAAGYRAEASGFRAMPAGPGAQASVNIASRQVEISALRGAVKVTDRQGVVIARVPAGRAIRLEPSTNATAGTSSVTGTVRREGARFLLRDEVTDLDVELRGNGLERHAGSRVHATGKARLTADGESQIVLVSRLRAAQEPPQDRPPGGNRPDPEPPKTGMSNGAKVAIIVAVAGGAAGGVIAATGKKGDSVSR